MTNERVEIITSVQRRRRWNSAEKRQLVAESLEPGASVSVVAREAGIHPSQLYGWRRQLSARRSAAREVPRTSASGCSTLRLQSAWKMMLMLE